MPPPSLRAQLPAMRIHGLRVSALSVPLIEPFVIASGRIDATRAALVAVEASVPDSRLFAVGLGEAAALPPVTRIDQPQLLAMIAPLAVSSRGCELRTLRQLDAALDRWLPDLPVARAGVECALLDAWSQLAGTPLGVLLGGALPCTLRTDMTLPIGEPEHMAKLARAHFKRGFDTFKIKVGKRIDDDVRVLEKVATAVPAARIRLDANAGFKPDEALRLCAEAKKLRLPLECFEQPCAEGDLHGMAEVKAKAGVPVIADESVKTLADLERVIKHRAASGVNLKLVKSGGVLPALAIGRAARAAGLRVMCGGMVETRLGMSAMAHVACALGGADYVDLDTAFLLAEDPFVGGYSAQGADLQLTGGPGLDLRLRG